MKINMVAAHLTVGTWCLLVGTIAFTPFWGPINIVVGFLNYGLAWVARKNRNDYSS